VRRCHVCGLALAGTDVHLFDRECVEALKRELERLDGLYQTARRDRAGED
jgi:hypothetical protein